MTEPGSVVPPAPGWWVRSEHIGVGQGTYGWSSSTVGARAPQGHSSGTYGWTTADTIGLKNLPTFIGANGSVSSSTVTIPAHQIGDIITIFAFQGAGGGVFPIAQSASGTVPAWAVLDAANSAGTSSCTSGTWYFVATATNHTSGIWSNVDGLIAAVIRNPAASPIGGHADAGGVAGTSGPAAPTVTLTHADGTSLLLHFFGLRLGGAWSAYNGAPTGYTQRVATATGTWGGVCLDTKNVTTTDGSIIQPVNASPSGNEYRGATIEIRAY